MKLQSITKNVVTLLAYFLLAGVTVYLYPRYDGSFPYRYEIGRPWSYDRLVLNKRKYYAILLLSTPT